MIGYSFSGIDKPETANGLWGLRYAEFVVPLVKGMQEQQSTIELLQGENKQLKNEILELRKELEDIKELLKGKN